MHMHDPLDGRLPFTLKGAPSGKGFLKDFWAWSFSTLHNTYLRGYIAEYLVYKSMLDPHSQLSVPVDHLKTKIEGDIHDLIFFIKNKKYTIQVKSKDSYSKDQRFITSFARGYDSIKDKDTHKDLWSDIYIFAYLNLDKTLCERIKNRHLNWNRDHNWQPAQKPAHKTDQYQLARSVIELENWKFYVLPHAALKDRKSITFKKLQSETHPVKWDDLASEIYKTAATFGTR
ncbi:hypothetical protein [Pseudomonas mosselii]|uniref:PD(D/E)XK endonuclease domain-containing protein n=3 Tax=Pseudomonas mosselii TaxID=78327 RepID=A0ABX9B5X5_9PSED|nr:hypothetical protein [Pseudomonas mosselii]MBH3310343.1 hypothetical protein [Pseudomonas mosselii]MBH3326145.1 hypothetical protein [Pseudomonas mosselii]MBS9763305.1 hypothetical protein [Pseudomonas mosselii]MCL8303142.1 hypothetical protein [Pseudomonas mosselii]MCL8343210.1 hypothetical protein [Pseudomonas mosselii]